MTKSCECKLCVSLCKNYPGWMTPDEAQAAIDDGKADQLMMDWLEPSSELGNQDRIFVLCPASMGYEGAKAPEINGFMWSGTGPCTFLSKGKCTIHDSGFKPLQCRTAYGCNAEEGTDKYAIARLWQTREAQDLLKNWSVDRVLV